MEISEVRVKLIQNPTDRLKAFCSVTLDGSFVIRDIKLIEGGSGIFVAMPSRKLTDHCPSCGSKNHLRARFCNDCGAELAPDRVKRDDAGRKKLHADIAHPINSDCRQRLQKRIVEAYEEEYGKSQEPGYQPPAFDDNDDYDAKDDHDMASPEVQQAGVSEPEPQPAACDHKHDDDYDPDDYQNMITELKGDAATRRRDHERPPMSDEKTEDSQGFGAGIL